MMMMLTVMMMTPSCPILLSDSLISISMLFHLIIDSSTVYFLLAYHTKNVRTVLIFYFNITFFKLYYFFSPKYIIYI